MGKKEIACLGGGEHPAQVEIPFRHGTAYQPTAFPLVSLCLNQMHSRVGGKQKLFRKVNTRESNHLSQWPKAVRAFPMCFLSFFCEVKKMDSNQEHLSGCEKEGLPTRILTAYDLSADPRRTNACIPRKKSLTESRLLSAPGTPKHSESA